MNITVTPTYQISFVALSYVISVIGSFVALTAARRISTGGGQVSLFNTATAGLALGGIGVWSMHFVGMLALDLQMGVGYSLVETLVSLVAAVVATSLALGYVAKAPRLLSRIMIAGSLLGAGVCVMHYLGMYGMRFGGVIDWSFGIVGLSVVIAVVAASAALWLAFNTKTLAIRLVAACVMGVAVCAMHYTGMAAADFICTTANPNAMPTGFGVISRFELPFLVSVTAVGMALVLAIDQAFQYVQEPAAA